MNGINKTLVLVALITIIPTTISSIAAWRAQEAKDSADEAKAESIATKAIVVPLALKVEEVKKQTDGITEKLMASTLKVGKAEGKKQGVQEGVAAERARTDAATVNHAKGVAAGVAAEKAKPWYAK